jgi:hypothetical protein
MDSSYREILRDLFICPKRFYDEGRSYALLQAFFGGAPIEALRPLLKSDLFFVRRVGVFIVAELGIGARDLLDDVVPFLQASDRYLQYYTMEVVAVCAQGSQAPRFALVVQMLDNEDEGLRQLAMRLTSRVDALQIEGAKSWFTAGGPRQDVHIRGLDVISAGQTMDPTVVSAMICSIDPLTRRYGAIAASRLIDKVPSLMNEVESSSDAELRAFRHRIVTLMDGIQPG